MPALNRLPINTNNDDDHYETLMERQAKADKDYDTSRNYNSIPVVSTGVVQSENGAPWTHGTIMVKKNEQSTKYA